ncbi:MAG: phage major capsid protein [Gammaproteobacteria bacterium]|nr:phage major capsid protein [Gammaproteobacteria bacterium]
MMTKLLKKLKDERGQLATEMRALNNTLETEERGFTAEEQEKWDRMVDGIGELDARIEQQRQADSLISGVDDLDRPEVRTQDADSEGSTQESRDEMHQRAFDRLIRSESPGLSGLEPDQRQIMREFRAQSVGTDSAGGYTVPEGFVNSLREAMLAFSGIKQNASVITTSSGNDLPFPTVNDTGNSGALLAENTQDSEQDVTFGVTTLQAYKYTSKIVRVSVELMQDSAFDMNAYLAKALGERLGRINATHFATGTGSSQPNGLITAATVGKTAASATAITYLELLDLKHSVDPAYRMGAKWGFNDATFLLVKKLLDGDSRPLWLPDVAGDRPGRFDGDEYFIDQGIPSAATTTKPVVYGDISQYTIREVRDVTLVRLVERYADYHQVGFIAFNRCDSDLVNAGTNPVKVLQMA